MTSVWKVDLFFSSKDLICPHGFDWWIHCVALLSEKSNISLEADSLPLVVKPWQQAVVFGA